MVSMSVATLIIDMQVDFFVHQRLSDRRAELTANINELLELSRAFDAPIIWIRQEFYPDLRDATLEMKRNNIHVVIAGTPGASLLPELAFQPGDHVITKKRYSAFFGTDLDDLLSKLQATKLIVAGINTHACVRTTVVDAYQRDYDVILARDCIESMDEEHHEVTWRYLDGKLGRGMSNEEIRSLLASTC